MKTERKSILDTVAKTLEACMKSGLGPTSQIQLGKKIGIGQSTVGRILKGQNDTRISTLDKIAAKYCLETWQILVPDLDPRNPPVMKAISPAEAALYERLAAIKKK